MVYVINGVIEDRSALQPKIIPFPRLDSDPLEYLMEVMLMMTMMMMMMVIIKVMKVTMVK